MPSKQKTKKVVAPLGDRIIPASDLDIIFGEPADKNPYKREMGGDSTWFEDRLGEMHGSIDDKLDVEAVMRRDYADLLRSPDATLILMAILRELVKMRCTHEH